MIPLEKQVTSLEPSMRLKELGVKQDSVYYWTWAEWNGKTEWVLIPWDKAIKLKKEKYSAFTVAELGEMLPRTIQWHNLEYPLSYSIDDYGHKGFLHRVHYKRGTNSISSGGFKTEADARAEMRIWLIENKLVEVNRNEKNENAKRER